jgi:hypothetical protein
MPEVQPLKALYYPHVHFDSLGWVKAALLYWEKIVRLVPAGFQTWDPPEVHELAVEGLIENVSSAPYLHSADQIFAARLEEMLQTHLGPSLCLKRESGSLLHVADIEPGLLRQLQARRLAAAAGDWVTMSPDIATLYKITLATVAGEDLHAAPATDDPSCDVAATYFAHARLARDPKAMAPIDGFACVRQIQPFPSIEAKGLPVKDLVEIRDELPQSRREFRERVQASATAIATLVSVEAIRGHLTDLTTEIEREVRAERSAVRAANRRNFWKAVSVSMPASIGAAVTLAGAPILIAALGVAGSLGVGLTDWLLKRHHDPRAPSHYLLSLDAAVGTRSGPRGRDLEHGIGQRSWFRRFRHVPLVSRGNGRLGVLRSPIRGEGDGGDGRDRIL